MRRAFLLAARPAAVLRPVLAMLCTALLPGISAALVPPSAPPPAQRPDLRSEVMAIPVQMSAQDAGLQRWIAAFRSRAAAQGLSARVLDASFAGVRYDPEVVRKDRNQTEFTKQIWEYLDIAASDERVSNGRRALRDHGRVLDRVEAAYGVEKEIVAAIWGLESAYGERRGTEPLIQSLATLAYDGRRGRFFEQQLIAALKIVQAGDVAPSRMTGSWAGAMGHTQFIPTSYLAYAVDFTGDGRRDIWSDDPSDALASTAAYLKRFGWRKGQPWGVEVALPRGFDYSQAGKQTRRSPADWARLGVRHVSGAVVPDYGAASILLPAGARGAAFMIFDNFKVISRYNAADAYVIGVGHLADRIAGAGPIRAQWPVGDRGLTRAERRDLQARLSRRGFDTGGVDGIIGPRSLQAIRGFQRSVGMIPDGYASLDLLQRLR